MCIRRSVILLFILILLSSCSKETTNPVSPKSYPPATTPEILLDNLSAAIVSLDEVFYQSLFSEDFLFREYNCNGNLGFINDFDEELDIIVGSESQPSIFRIFVEIKFSFQLDNQYTEAGIEPDPSLADSLDYHPGEDWEILRGRLKMELIDEKSDCILVDQFMVFKLRENNDQLWKIAQWTSEPPEDDCSTGKLNLAVKEDTWGNVKRTFK